MFLFLLGVSGSKCSYSVLVAIICIYSVNWWFLSYFLTRSLKFNKKLHFWKACEWYIIFFISMRTAFFEYKIIWLNITINMNTVNTTQLWSNPNCTSTNRYPQITHEFSLSSSLPLSSVKNIPCDAVVSEGHSLSINT